MSAQQPSAPLSQSSPSSSPSKLQLENQSLKRRLVQYAATLEKLTTHAKREIDQSTRARDEALSRAADASALRQNLATTQGSLATAEHARDVATDARRHAEARLEQLQATLASVEHRLDEARYDDTHLNTMREELSSLQKELPTLRRLREQEISRSNLLAQQLEEEKKKSTSHDSSHLRLQKIRTDHAQLLTDCDAAQLTIANMRRNESSTIRERDGLHMKCRESEDMNEMLRQQLAQAQDRLRLFEQRIKDVEASEVQHSQRSTEVRKQADDTVLALRQELDRALKDVGERNTVIEELKETRARSLEARDAVVERDALRSNVQQLQEELDQSTEMLTRAAIDSLTEKSTIRKLEDLLSRSRAEMGTHVKHGSSLETKIIAMSEQLGAFEKDIDGMRSSKRHLVDECHKYQLQVHEQSSIIATKSRSIEELGTDKNDRAFQADSLKLTLSNAKNALVKKESDILKVTSDLEEMCAQLKSTNKELDDSHSELSVLRKELVVGNEQITKLNVEKERLKSTIAELQVSKRQLEDLSALVAAKDEEIATLKRWCTTLKAESGESVREKKRLSDMLSDVSDELKRANHELDLLRNMRKDQEMLAQRISEISETSTRELNNMRQSQSEQAEALAKSTVEAYQSRLTEIQQSSRDDIAESVTVQLRTHIMPHIMRAVDSKARTLVHRLAKHVESFTLDDNTMYTSIQGQSSLHPAVSVVEEQTKTTRSAEYNPKAEGRTPVGLASAPGSTGTSASLYGLAPKPGTADDTAAKISPESSSKTETVVASLVKTFERSIDLSAHPQDPSSTSAGGGTALQPEATKIREGPDLTDIHSETVHSRLTQTYRDLVEARATQDLPSNQSTARIALQHSGREADIPAAVVTERSPVAARGPTQPKTSSSPQQALSNENGDKEAEVRKLGLSTSTRTTFSAAPEVLELDGSSLPKRSTPERSEDLEIVQSYQLKEGEVDESLDDAVDTVESGSGLIQEDGNATDESFKDALEEVVKKKPEEAVSDVNTDNRSQLLESREAPLLAPLPVSSKDESTVFASYPPLPASEINSVEVGNLAVDGIEPDESEHKPVIIEHSAPKSEKAEEEDTTSRGIDIENASGAHGAFTAVPALENVARAVVLTDDLEQRDPEDTEIENQSIAHIAPRSKDVGDHSTAEAQSEHEGSVTPQEVLVAEDNQVFEANEEETTNSVYENRSVSAKSEIEGENASDTRESDRVSKELPAIGESSEIIPKEESDLGTGSRIEVAPDVPANIGISGTMAIDSRSDTVTQQVSSEAGESKDESSSIIQTPIGVSDEQDEVTQLEVSENMQGSTSKIVPDNRGLESGTAHSSILSGGGKSSENKETEHEPPAGETNVSSQEAPVSDTDVLDQEPKARETDVSSHELPADGTDVSDKEPETREADVSSRHLLSRETDVSNHELPADGTNVSRHELPADGTDVSDKEPEAREADVSSRHLLTGEADVSSRHLLTGEADASSHELPADGTDVSSHERPVDSTDVSSHALRAGETDASSHALRAGGTDVSSHQSLSGDTDLSDHEPLADDADLSDQAPRAGETDVSSRESPIEDTDISSPAFNVATAAKLRTGFQDDVEEGVHEKILLASRVGTRVEASEVIHESSYTYQETATLDRGIAHGSGQASVSEDIQRSIDGGHISDPGGSSTADKEHIVLSDINSRQAVTAEGVQNAEGSEVLTDDESNVSQKSESRSQELTPAQSDSCSDHDALASEGTAKVRTDEPSADDEEGRLDDMDSIPVEEKKSSTPEIGRLPTPVEDHSSVENSDTKDEAVEEEREVAYSGTAPSGDDLDLPKPGDAVENLQAADNSISEEAAAELDGISEIDATAGTSPRLEELYEAKSPIVAFTTLGVVGNAEEVEDEVVGAKEVVNEESTQVVEELDITDGIPADLVDHGDIDEDDEDGTITPDHVYGHAIVEELNESSQNSQSDIDDGIQQPEQVVAGTASGSSTDVNDDIQMRSESEGSAVAQASAEDDKGTKSREQESIGRSIDEATLQDKNLTETEGLQDRTAQASHYIGTGSEKLDNVEKSLDRSNSHHGSQDVPDTPAIAVSKSDSEAEVGTKRSLNVERSHEV